MKMVLTDKAPRRNGLPGAEVEITNNCVRFFEEQGWAVRVDEAKREKEDAALESMRAEYHRLTGGHADRRWKEETLRAKMDEAKVENAPSAKSKSMKAADDGSAKSDGTARYNRRDMQAED